MSDREPPYLRLEPSEPDDEVPSSSGGWRQANSGEQRFILRSPTGAHRSTVSGIVDLLQRSGDCPTIHNNHDTSHPFHERHLQVFSVRHDAFDQLVDVIEDFGLRWQYTDVTQFHLMPIPTRGQMIVDTPECGCGVDELPCPHETGGETDTLLPLSLER